MRQTPHSMMALFQWSDAASQASSFILSTHAYTPKKSDDRRDIYTGMLCYACCKLCSALI